MQVLLIIGGGYQHNLKIRYNSKETTHTTKQPQNVESKDFLRQDSTTRDFATNTKSHHSKITTNDLLDTTHKAESLDSVNVDSVNTTMESSHICSQNGKIIAPHIDYMIFLDPDDYWELDCVEQCVKNMQGVEIVWFKYESFYDDTKEKGGTNLDMYGYDKTQIITPFEFLSNIIECRKSNDKLWFAFSWSGMIDFAYLMRINLRFIDGIIYEDIAFGILLFMQSSHICVLYETLNHYRIRQNSISTHKGKTTKKRISPFMYDLFHRLNDDAEATFRYHHIDSLRITTIVLRKFMETYPNRSLIALLEDSKLVCTYYAAYFAFFELPNNPMRILPEFTTLKANIKPKDFKGFRKIKILGLYFPQIYFYTIAKILPLFRKIKNRIKRKTKE